MWVVVVSLRKDGVKLPYAEVRAGPGVRGQFSMEPRQTTTHGRSVVASMRTAGSGHGTAPMELFDARIERLRGESWVVLGKECCGPFWNERYEPQAWWCRLDGEAYGTGSDAATGQLRSRVLTSVA